MTLKPNTAYVYEKVDGILYAKEFGSTTRFEIGRDDERTRRDQMDVELWNEILYASLTDEALQQELERVKIFYLLSKKEKNSIFHHPV